MAHHASAKKRIRQTKRRTVVNTARRSQIRTSLRKVEEAIAGGDKDVAQAAFKAVQPDLMRGARKGLMHANTMARRLSRLSARIKAMNV